MRLASRAPGCERALAQGQRGRVASQVRRFQPTVRYLIPRSRLLRDEGDRYAIDRTIPSSVIPPSLHASLLARLDRLGPTTKEVAQMGAAIGRDFSYELLAVVAGRSEAELQHALTRLVEAGLILQRGALPEALFPI